jgi:DNA-binding response OmpR family regulator
MASGAVVSSEELLDRVWDENADPFTTTVRVTMMTLRRKLGEPAIIDTVVGSGYRIDPSVLNSDGAHGAAEGAGTAG